MPWKATTTSVTKNEFNVVVVVDFVNDTNGEKITRTIPGNDLTVVRLAVLCQRFIQQLEDRDSALAVLSPGTVTLPRDATSGPLFTAQQAMNQADAFFDKLDTLNSLKLQAAKGIIDASDPTIVDAAAAVKAAYLPRFATDPRFK